MKRFLFPVVLLSFVASALAQTPQQAVLPSGALLNRAPDYSKWTVVINGSAGSPDMGSKEKHAPTNSLSTLTKAGGIILEQNVDTQGQKEEIWHCKGIRVEKDPKTAAPLISPDRGTGDIYSVDFSQSDFAGLSWVSPKTFAGIEKYEGRDCIVFRDKVSPLTAEYRRQEMSGIAIAQSLGQDMSEILVPAIAYIDLQTRLPVLVTFGNQKRVYQYSTIPHDPLTLPPDLAEALKGYGEKLQRLSAPSVRAY